MSMLRSTNTALLGYQPDTQQGQLIGTGLIMDLMLSKIPFYVMININHQLRKVAFKAEIGCVYE